jgi:hypothetical protein
LSWKRALHAPVFLPTASLFSFVPSLIVFVAALRDYAASLSRAERD